MKRTFLFVLFLLFLSGLAGYLLSKASLVGQVGIHLLYTEYKFLNVWWQAGLLLFLVWMLLFFLQGRAHRKLQSASAKMVHLGAIAVALIGLFFTYQDFRHTVSHRLLGERFHLGAYLFWIGWLCVSLFYLTTRKKENLPADVLSNADLLPSGNTDKREYR